MGWANCGTDSLGRNIGYAHAGTCDHPGCKKKIDRGLAYACGGMHGEDEVSCEKYFCEEHLSNYVSHNGGLVMFAIHAPRSLSNQVILLKTRKKE